MSEKKVSVVVPCYEEALNIEPLCTRLNKTASKENISIEIILVDDYSGKGSDDTKIVVDKLKTNGMDNIVLLIRLPEEGKGLSSAVLYGLSKAKHEVLLVMDADLQHEPESLPTLVNPIFTNQVDFVFGSRHVGGGETHNFSAFRQIVSKGATLLAYGLTTQSDPMSGFFALNKIVLEKSKRNNLSPVGYKIGLEILVRSKISANRVKDVPIKFQERTAGESKLTPEQYVLYLLHLLKLYWFIYPIQVFSYFLCGFVTTLLMLYLIFVVTQ